MRKYSERSQEELTLKERIELLAEEKRDNDRSLSNKKQAEQMGINYNTFRKYVTEQEDTTQCSISNLAKIANYYNVSTDYLLGRTDSKSIDNKVQATREVTGLSDDAINKLIHLNNRRNIRAYIELLSMVIEETDFEYLIGLFEGYLTSGNEKIDESIHVTTSISINKKDVALVAINNLIKDILDHISTFYMDRTTPTEILLINRLYEKGTITDEEHKKELTEFIQKFI